MAKTKELTKKQLNVVEDLGWSVQYDDGGWVGVSQYSPKGEDFSFAAEVKDFAKSVMDVYESFDTEEHVLMWMEAKKNGVRDVPSLKALVEDADAIDEMLKELAYALAAL